MRFLYIFYVFSPFSGIVDDYAPPAPIKILQKTPSNESVLISRYLKLADFNAEIFCRNSKPSSSRPYCQRNTNVVTDIGETLIFPSKPL